jgi:glucose uptake protein GlcU
LISKYITIIRIIIAALAVSMLVAGPNLALLKQHQGYAASQTKKQEQNTNAAKDVCNLLLRSWLLKYYIVSINHSL